MGFKSSDNIIKHMYVAVPHERLPYMVDDRITPPDPDDGDDRFGGDNDLYSSVCLADVPRYQVVQHQYHAVRAVAAEWIAEHDWEIESEAPMLVRWASRLLYGATWTDEGNRP